MDFIPAVLLFGVHDSASPPDELVIGSVSELGKSFQILIAKTLTLRSHQTKFPPDRVPTKQALVPATAVPAPGDKGPAAAYLNLMSTSTVRPHMV